MLNRTTTTFTYFISISLAVLILSVASTAQAAPTVDEYLPLTGIPGVTQGINANERDVPALGVFFANMFYLGVGIAGILAVIMLMWGGIQYMTSEAMGGKEAAKSRIWSAIVGLILVLMSWLIIFTINPQILDLKLTPQNTEGANPAGTTVVSGAESLLESDPNGNPLNNVLNPGSVPNQGLQDPGPGINGSFFQLPQ